MILERNEGDLCGKEHITDSRPLILFQGIIQSATESVDTKKYLKWTFWSLQQLHITFQKSSVWIASLVVFSLVRRNEVSDR